MSPAKHLNDVLERVYDAMLKPPPRTAEESDTPAQEREVDDPDLWNHDIEAEEKLFEDETHKERR